MEVKDCQKRYSKPWILLKRNICKWFILVAFLLLICRSSAESICNTDEFEDQGICIRCQGSCAACDDYSSCYKNGAIKCKENFTPNSTTGFCDWIDCPDGTYYSEPIKGCARCEGSCNSLCGYQSHCYRGNKILNQNKLNIIIIN